MCWHTEQLCKSTVVLPVFDRPPSLSLGGWQLRQCVLLRAGRGKGSRWCSRHEACLQPPGLDPSSPAAHCSGAACCTATCSLQTTSHVTVTARMSASQVWLQATVPHSAAPSWGCYPHRVLCTSVCGMWAHAEASACYRTQATYLQVSVINGGVGK